MANLYDPVPYPLADKLDIRSRLNVDREWSLYALADLDDEMFAHCDWWGLADGIALVFGAIAVRPIFVLGDASVSRRLLAALPVPTGYLNLKPHQLSSADGLYRYRERHEMNRMLLDAFQLRPGVVEVLARKIAAKSSDCMPRAKELGSPSLHFNCRRAFSAVFDATESWWLLPGFKYHRSEKE